MRKCLLFLVTLTFLAVTNGLPAQGTAFTYQGQLSASGAPANGKYDFTFALFNSSTTNTGQVGGTLTNLDVGVTNGLFTVTLDFGANFPGASRWLAIGVRTNGGSSFTALNPLQELTPTPYAIYAPTAGAAASANSVAGSNIVGTITPAQLPAGIITNGETGVNISGSFTGNAAGLTNLNPAALAANAVPVPVSTNYLTNEYVTNGTYTITVPSAATQMVVKLWGAGGGPSTDTDGGGGAFSQVTLNVTPGNTYVVVVGQNGGYGGGAGANDGSGGVGTSGAGNGGQASSLFQYTGSAYIMNAVAGGGGGGGGAGGSGYGGNSGQGIGSGSGYSTNATTIGEPSLSQMGGDGEAGVNVGQPGGGSGGGYGGGTASGDGQSGGGYSYGDLAIAGGLNTPGNTSDPNYLAGAADGGNYQTGPASGSDGLAVVIFTQIFTRTAIAFSLPVQAPSFEGNGSMLSNLNASQITGTIDSSNVIIGGAASNLVAPLTLPPNVPASPIGAVGPYSINSLAVAGRYVCALGFGLQIFDVSAPSSPVLAGYLGSVVSSAPGSGCLAVAGRYAYAIDDGLYTVDIGNPGAPVVVGSVSAAGGVFPQAVAVAGRYAYVANSFTGGGSLQVFDIGKTTPVSVSTVATATYPNAIAISGHYAYLAEGSTGSGALQVFDITDPASPTAVGQAGIYEGLAIAVSGRYAYSSGNGDFYITDVTNATSPTNVVTVSTPGFYEYAVAVAGRYAFIGGQNNATIYVYDVSTPASPTLVGTIGLGGVTSLAVSGRYLYAGNSSGLSIFDLGGEYAQSLEVGTLEAGTLQTRDTATVGNNLNVRGGLITGGNALVTGGLSVSGTGIASPNYALYANGVVAGVGAYVNASDARYKTNIEPLTHALDKIMAMRGVEYDWRSNAFPQVNFDHGKQLGFVAQEIKEVLPEVVSQDAQGYYSIAYSKVIPVLVEAIKDQQKEMAEKNGEIQDLKQSVAELKQRVQSLSEKK